MFFEHLRCALEALLFASGDPVPAFRLAELLEISEDHVNSLIARMQEEMTDESRGLTIMEVAGGYQLCTKPALAPVVEKLASIQDSRLSAAAMETLSIIAFKQPVTRQEIESIRGVKADRLVHNLLERRLIKELGRKDTIGRPILYGTTTEFLICLGLKSLQDLPVLTGLVESTAEESTAPSALSLQQQKK